MTAQRTCSVRPSPQISESMFETSTFARLRVLIATTFLLLATPAYAEQPERVMPHSEDEFSRLERLDFQERRFQAINGRIDSAIAKYASVFEKELAAVDKAFQMQLGHLREIQRTEIDASSKRVDDILSTTANAVDRFGVVLAGAGLLITVLLAGIGLLGSVTVIRRARVEAQRASEAWFEESSKELLRKIERLEASMQEALASIDGKVKHVGDVAQKAETIIRRRQDAMSQAQDNQPAGASSSPADRAVLERRDEELRDKPESSYSFEDWNARAHAAYSAGNYSDSAYFWERASQAQGASSAQIAQTLNFRGIAQAKTGDNAGAVDSYNDVVRRYSGASELAVRAQVAQALSNRGVREAATGAYSSAIESYNDVLARFGDASELTLKARVAQALNNRGVAHHKARSLKSAVDTYDEVIQRYGDASEALLKVQVAQALNSKGALFNQADAQMAIDNYDEVIRRYDHASEPLLRAQVAQALNNKGLRRAKIGDSAGAIECFNEVIERYQDAPEPALRLQVAQALGNRSTRESKAGDREKAITTRNEVLHRYADAPETALKVQIAKTLNSLGALHENTGNPALAADSYDEVVRRYENATEASLREQIAKALLSKGLLLKKSGDLTAALENFKEIIVRYSDATDEVVRAQVSRAKKESSEAGK